MLLALLIACGPKHLPTPVPSDPATLIARARAEAVPGPQIAHFTIRIETPDGTISALGTGIFAAPNRFRVELRGPIGPAQLTAASDGHRVTAFILGKNTAYVGEDAEAAVRSWTGGAAGLDAVVSLLLGRLPELGTPSSVTPMPTWSRADGAVVRIALDGTTAHLVRVEVIDAAGVPGLTANYAPAAFPAHLDIDLPALHAKAAVDYSDWQTGAPPDAAFTVFIPPGATIIPINTASIAPDALPTPPAPPPSP